MEEVVNLLTRRTQGGHWRGRKVGVLKWCSLLSPADKTQVFTFCIYVKVQVLIEKNCLIKVKVQIELIYSNESTKVQVLKFTFS